MTRTWSTNTWQDLSSSWVQTIDTSPPRPFADAACLSWRTKNTPTCSNVYARVARLQYEVGTLGCFPRASLASYHDLKLTVHLSLSSSNCTLGLKCHWGATWFESRASKKEERTSNGADPRPRAIQFSNIPQPQCLNILQPCFSTLSHALPITPHDWKPLTGPLLPARKHGLAAGPFSPQWLSAWNISNLGLAANSPDTIPRRAKGLRLRTSTSATLINSQHPRNTVPFQLFDIASGFSMQEKRIEWLTNLQVENTQHLHSEILVSFGQIQHI